MNQTPKTMPHVDVRDKVLQQTLRQLDTLGCTYHIFCPWTGDEHGFPLAPTAEVPDLKRVVLTSTPASDEPEKKRRAYDRVRSEARNRWMLPHLLKIKIGNVPINVPLGEYTMDEMQGAIGARLSAAFGTDGAYITSRDHSTQSIQVLVTRNVKNPKLGEAEAIIKTFGQGALSAYAENCLDEHRAVSKDKLQALQSVMHNKHKTA